MKFGIIMKSEEAQINLNQFWIAFTRLLMTMACMTSTFKGMTSHGGIAEMVLNRLINDLIDFALLLNSPFFCSL